MQEQPPHWQLLPQVCRPLPSQLVMAFGVQAPCPEHVPQADQEPLALHVRVWVPQLPHAWELGPMQGHAPVLQVTPPTQTFPHVPQLALSICSSTHALPQSS